MGKNWCAFWRWAIKLSDMYNSAPPSRPIPSCKDVAQLPDASISFQKFLLQRSIGLTRLLDNLRHLQSNRGLSGLLERERDEEDGFQLSWIIFKQKIFNIKYGDRERRTVFKRRRWPFINRFDKFSKRFEKLYLNVICLCCFLQFGQLEKFDFNAVMRMKQFILFRRCIFFFFKRVESTLIFFYIYIYFFGVEIFFAVG